MKSIYLITKLNVQSECLRASLTQSLGIDCYLIDIESLTASVPLTGYDSFSIKPNSLLILDNQYSTTITHCALIDYKMTTSYQLSLALINDDSDQVLDHFENWPSLMGVFQKSTSFTRLCEGIKVIMQGELWLSRNLQAELINRLRNKPHANTVPTKPEVETLSSREMEILKQLSEGHSNLDIADNLFLSENTIKSHLYRIYKKIEVKNRTQAIKWYEKLEIV